MYLGKASDVTLADIPDDLRKDRKILTFIFAHMHSNEEKEILLSNIKEQIYKLLIDCDLNGLVSIYEKYSRLFRLVDL